MSIVGDAINAAEASIKTKKMSLNELRQEVDKLKEEINEAVEFSIHCKNQNLYYLREEMNKAIQALENKRARLQIQLDKLMDDKHEILIES